MNEIDMKNVFIKILKFGGIYEDFIKNFGKDFWAENKYSDGWSVDTFNNSFDYYEFDVYMDHADGYYDSFSKRCLGHLDYYLFEELFDRYGYYVEYNGGDEEDFVFSLKFDLFKLIRQSNTKIAEIQFHIEELSEWCENMEKRIRGLENDKR